MREEVEELAKDGDERGVEHGELPRVWDAHGVEEDVEDDEEEEVGGSIAYYLLHI